MTLAIGVDLGTSSVRAVAFNPELRAVAAAQRDYPTAVPAPGRAELDPGAILEATGAALRELFANPAVASGKVSGIGFSGFMHGVLGVDESLEPLTPCLGWADLRAAAEVKAMRQEYDGTTWYRRTGCPLHPIYLPAKLRWLRRHERALFRRIRWFVSAKEWVMARLTGKLVCDQSIAAGSGLLNISRLEWEPSVLEAAGLTVDRLPPLVPPTTVLDGFVSPLARRWDLPAGIPVVVGASDAALASVGCGAVHRDTMAAMIGTSGAVRVLADAPVFDPEAHTWCYYLGLGKWVVGGATNNGGNILRWFRDQLGEPETLSAQARGVSAYEVLVAEAAEAPPGSGGLILLPFLAGERAPNWNEDARGVLFGLNLGHGRPHLARACLEGVAFHLHGVLQTLRELVGSPRRVRVSGGFAKSPLWLAIVASVFGVPLEVPETVEGSAAGAAFLVRLALGEARHLDEVAGLVRANQVVEPDFALQRVYAHLYAQYLRLYHSLQPEFAAIARFQGGEMP